MDHEELIVEDKPTIRLENGINLFVAVVILTGEMAGSGMLQLPYSMVGTGKLRFVANVTFVSYSYLRLIYQRLGYWGLIFVVLCAGNAAFIGSRLGICWEILADTHVEFQSEQGRATRISDPYPLMAEKAGRTYSPKLGKFLRLSSIGDLLKLTFSKAFIITVFALSLHHIDALRRERRFRRPYRHLPHRSDRNLQPLHMDGHRSSRPDAAHLECVPIYPSLAKQNDIVIT